jgi:uncharacterized membrane protein HdeD (DUF308 family)
VKHARAKSAIDELSEEFPMPAQVRADWALPAQGRERLAAVADNWWLLLLRGLAAVAFGVIAFLWPAITLAALTYLFGTYVIVDGLVAIWAAFNLRGQVGVWWLGLSGVVSILAGIAAFVDTGLTAFVLLMFIAVWAILMGALQLYAAIQIWKVIDNNWWLILSGVLSVAFGIALIAWPVTGALALIWAIAWFALFFGFMFVGLAFELKKFKRT